MIAIDGKVTKITATHRARLAYVYIRPSSLSPVIHHHESTDLQYRLVERAIQLGWPRERVKVIDEDLGKSGASAEQRYGFQFLMTEIGLGHVGLVISLDASRLARNNSDWYRLMELCSLFGVVLADGEQIYDPGAYHDRLLLGLSGMMSEAELHHLKQRLQAGARHKAERGELRHPLPVGLVRQRDGTVILNPDEEVQARLRLIFTQFTQLGSARAVRNYLARERLLIPSRPGYGPAPHDTVWSPPSESAIRRILHNPAYAGAYVHGHYGTDPAHPRPGRYSGSKHERPLEQWPVCLPGVYPAYLSWETYLPNRARLQANRNAFDQQGRGVPREGQALLQGIVRCGRCGRHLRVRYSGPRGNYPVYQCGAEAQHYGGPYCQEGRATALDATVEQHLLEALAPDRIALALEALEQLEREAEALDRQWQLRLERVRFEAHRAQRQYEAVEPENRLVARLLERQWEEKLRRVETTEREYETWKQTHHPTLTAQDREAILALGQDLPRVWQAETTTAADRKHLLRLVIKEVLVDQKRQRGKVWFQLNWQTGASTVHELIRQGVGYQESSDGDRVQERVRQLHTARQTDAQIAATLNSEGYHTTHGQPFKGKNIWYLRQRWQLPSVKTGDLMPDRQRWADGTYTIQGVMQAAGVDKATVHRWLKQGRLPGMQLGPYMLWRIVVTADQLRTLRKHVDQVRRLPRQPCPLPAEIGL